VIAGEQEQEGEGEEEEEDGMRMQAAMVRRMRRIK
jgi:hypothetical protein